MNGMKHTHLVPLLLLASVVHVAWAEDLNCLAPVDGKLAARTLYYAELQAEAFAALDRRRAAYERLKTSAEIKEYQVALRAKLTEQLGGLPPRTPLNAQTVGTIDGDAYRIEKVMFESQPRHHVTANLYLPKGNGPFPAVLVSSGHSRTAKTADYNQRFAIAMANQGIAALAYDPIGQGERSQILDDTGKPQFNGTTTEHFLVGVGSILVGANTASYRIWDGIRAIDYLASRPEIDATRIGFTGCSGGGTLTSYIMALDDRVACAAPACYLTTFRHLIETIGPQDAEQNIFGQIALGIDHPDYVLMRAPRPTIISATTSDFFDIQGTWDNFRQAKRIYARLGFPERIDLVEAEGTHGVQRQNLLAIVRFMRRWLQGRDEPVELGELPIRREAELLCTPRGQTLLLDGERSVYDLNVERAAEFAVRRAALWQPAAQAETLAKVRQLVGVRPLDKFTPPKFEDVGRVNREGYHIDKVILRTDSTVPIPALTYHPPHPVDDAYVYLHDGGKTADGGPGGPIEKLVNDGYAVVAIDLRGTGETAAGTAKPDPLLGDWKPFSLAYLLGRSQVGIHTEDALAAGHFVAYYKRKMPRKVHLVGVGQAGIVALHAAALEPQLFASVTVRDTITSWTNVVGQKVPRGQLPSTVHGALKVYDLPDLAQAIGPKKLKVESSAKEAATR